MKPSVQVLNYSQDEDDGLATKSKSESEDSEDLASYRIPDYTKIARDDSDDSGDERTNFVVP